MTTSSDLDAPKRHKISAKGLRVLFISDLGLNSLGTCKIEQLVAILENERSSSHPRFVHSKPVLNAAMKSSTTHVAVVRDVAYSKTCTV